MFRYLLAFVLVFCVVSSAEAHGRRAPQRRGGDFNDGFNEGFREAQRQQARRNLNFGGHHGGSEIRVFPFLRFRF